MWLENQKTTSSTECYKTQAKLLFISFKQVITMHFLLLAPVFICVLHLNINSIASYPVLKNVAYAKPVTLSSEMFPSSNAVNGLLFDFAHTLGEKSPWLRIDLEAQHVIHEVEVFARSDCCGNY